jgi:Leucine-rich repeat (LRR) protein
MGIVMCRSLLHSSVCSSQNHAIVPDLKSKYRVVKIGQWLKEFPHSLSKDCKRMWLCNNQVKYLLEDFMCTELVSLILTRNPFPCNVPERFMINLASLSVLDISFTIIRSVPTSLSQLRLLEFLSLAMTGIKKFPDLQSFQAPFFESWWLRQFIIITIYDRKTYRTPDSLFIGVCWIDVPLEISQLASLKTLYLTIHTKTDVMAFKGISNLIQVSL